MTDPDPEKSERVTMKDVARAAGVSQSTVSFVLNGLEEMRIGSETRKRVIEAADRLGYRRRSVGRPSSRRQAQTLGLMIDEIATSPFGAISIEGAQERAWAADALLEVAMTGGDRAYEAALLRKWTAEGVAGVIYASILTRSVAPPKGLRGWRAVLLNCYDPAGVFDSVVPAERRGGEAATRALIEAGAERIAFIEGEAWMEASSQRREGYERALRAAGRRLDPALIAQGDFLPSGGRTATLDLMRRSQPPDAIFCANDLTAVGCYEALKELGLRPGTDVAVMGYDDQEIAQHLSPALSTVLLPHREMGWWCVDRLLAPQPPQPEQTRMACPLAARDSHVR